MAAPKTYRKEAAKAQRLADAATDPATKAKYTKLAHDWTELALTADVQVKLEAAVRARGGVIPR